MNPQGILLMSLGSPEHLDEMEAYLADIRHGKPVPATLVEELQDRYRQAGGRSPLLDITRRQAAALEAFLNREGEKFKVYVGMRHWHPYIHEAMEEVVKDGVVRLVSLPLTPYYSRLSTEAYHQKVKEAKEKLNAKLEMIFVESWNVDPLLIETYADRVDQGLSKFPDRRGVKVLFTAHSLPERILREEDPYQDELLETVGLVASKLELTDWEFAYQSQGATSEPWLGPRVEEMLDKYAQTGINKVLVVPIGFVSDHMEILYDVDIQFKKLARERNIHLERSPSPNDSPSFIRTLASVALSSLSASGDRAGAAP